MKIIRFLALTVMFAPMMAVSKSGNACVTEVITVGDTNTAFIQFRNLTNALHTFCN